MEQEQWRSGRLTTVGTELDDIRDEVERAKLDPKAQFTTLRNDVKTAQENRENIKTQLKQKAKDLDDMKEDKSTIENELNQSNEMIRSLQDDLETLQQQHKALQERTEASHLEALKGKDQEIQKLLERSKSQDDARKQLIKLFVKTCKSALSKDFAVVYDFEELNLLGFPSRKFQFNHNPPLGFNVDKDDARAEFMMPVNYDDADYTLWNEAGELSFLLITAIDPEQVQGLELQEVRQQLLWITRVSVSRFVPQGTLGRSNTKQKTR